jgi:hemoglobin
MRGLILITCCAALAGCAPPVVNEPSNRSQASSSLFDELGGTAGITRIVEGLLINISEDERIVHHFSETDIDRLNEKLIEQLCVESGGPCKYTGDSMRDSHAGFDISEADFNALVENLIAAMEAQGVPVAAQNRLLARLAPMRSDIIYR